MTFRSIASDDLPVVDFATLKAYLKITTKNAENKDKPVLSNCDQPFSDRDASMVEILRHSVCISDLGSIAPN